ncbi:MAG: glycine--tRNA ligase subunit beta [Rickettsiaceae bacterium]|nr:glycine--tRNA ligase subunit beta [Rickettsiaceae bacterium]
MMKDLLIELYSEEIPAKMQAKAEGAYAEIFSQFFHDYGIKCDNLQIFIGPCRIVISAKIEENIPEQNLVIKGPKIDANKLAIEGFCKKNNCAIADLSEEEIGGQSVYVLKKKIDEGRSINLVREYFESLMRKFTWPKTMVWGSYSFAWVRPLKNILCLFGDEVINLKLGHIYSSNQSFGHKFMSPHAIEISSPSDYFKLIKESYVILDRKKRKSIILKSIEEICAKLDLIFDCDENLLEEVAGLCEFPIVLYDRIDAKFMDLPKEVLVTSLKNHQKYFTANTKSGSLAPYFFFATNICLENYKDIIEGNKVVLSARLSDALYFYKKDLATTQEQRFRQLVNIIYHQKLGTMQDKALRIEKITSYLDENLTIAARFAKSDLCSLMVIEFPELQGIMGGYYAASEGLNSDIAGAIKDHYLPNGLEDLAPSRNASIVSIADKIDSLVNLYIAGERATGSGDPYALRRYCLGIIRCIQVHKLEINILDLIKLSASLCKISPNTNDIEEIMSFIEERLKHFLKTQIPLEILNAALNLQKNPDILFNINIANSLYNILSNQKGKSLISLYKRAKNITENSEYYLDVQFNELEESESVLLDAIKEIEISTRKHLRNKDYEKALNNLLELEIPLQDFFDKNLINTQDTAIATKRKAIISKAISIFDIIANFSLL